LPFLNGISPSELTFLRPSRKIAIPPETAKVAELVDALVSGASGSQPWGFESPLSHQGSNSPRPITTFRVRLLFVDGSATAPAVSWPGHELAVVKLGRDVPAVIRDFRPDVLFLNGASANAVRIAKMLQEDWPNLRIVVTHLPSSDL
jgi:hypothetical protein